MKNNKEEMNKEQKSLNIKKAKKVASETAGNHDVLTQAEASLPNAKNLKQKTKKDEQAHMVKQAEVVKEKKVYENTPYTGDVVKKTSKGKIFAYVALVVCGIFLGCFLGVIINTNIIAPYYNFNLYVAAEYEPNYAAAENRNQNKAIKAISALDNYIIAESKLINRANVSVATLTTMNTNLWLMDNLKISDTRLKKGNIYYTERLAYGFSNQAYRSSFNYGTPNLLLDYGSSKIEDSSITAIWENAPNAITYTNYKNYFGTPVEKLLPYIVSESTIDSGRSGVVVEGQDEYTFKLVLKPIEGGLYKEKEISGLTGCKVFAITYLELNVTLNKSGEFLKIETIENYVISNGFLTTKSVASSTVSFSYNVGPIPVIG